MVLEYALDPLHREALDAYARQLSEGNAALEELRAMRRVFAVLCGREGGTITITAAEMIAAQHSPERIATVHTDPHSGDVSISILAG